MISLSREAGLTSSFQLCNAPPDADPDSDAEEDEDAQVKRAKTESEMEEVRRRLAAQQLESQPTGEMWQLQERQKNEVSKARTRQAAGKPARYYDDRYNEQAVASRLPPPMSPDEILDEDRG